MKIPEAGQGKRGESGHLGYLLRQASVAFRADMERALANLGVTQPQFAVLTMIAAYPGLSSADVARVSLLTPPTVSVIVGNLKKRGAVMLKAHPVHGRIQQLETTHAGNELLAACRARVDVLEARLTAGLTARELKIVSSWLVNVARRAAPT